METERTPWTREEAEQGWACRREDSPKPYWCLRDRGDGVGAACIQRFTSRRGLGSHQGRAHRTITQDRVKMPRPKDDELGGCCSHVFGQHFVTFEGNQQGCAGDDVNPSNVGKDVRCECDGFTIRYQP